MVATISTVPSLPGTAKDEHELAVMKKRQAR